MSFWSDLFKSLGISALGKFADNAVDSALYGSDYVRASHNLQLSGAQREANGFNAEQAAINRAFQSGEADKTRQFQVDFYNQFQSPSAQVSAFRSAGINPAAVYGGIQAPSASGGSSASGSQAVASNVGSAPLQSFESLANLYFQGIKARNESRLTDAQVAQIESQTALNEIDADFRAAEHSANIDSLVASAKSDLASADLSRSSIELNGVRVALTQSETDNNRLRGILLKLDADKAQLLLPYVEELAKSEIGVNNARSYLAYADAQKSFVDALLTQGLIDSGYATQLTNQVEENTKLVVRERKWYPVKSIVSSIATGVGAFFGIKGAFGAKAVKSASSVVKSVVGNPPTPFN